MYRTASFVLTHLNLRESNTKPILARAPRDSFLTELRRQLQEGFPEALKSVDADIITFCQLSNPVPSRTLAADIRRDCLSATALPAHELLGASWREQSTAGIHMLVSLSHKEMAV